MAIVCATAMAIVGCGGSAPTAPVSRIAVDSAQPRPSLPITSVGTARAIALLCSKAKFGLEDDEADAPALMQKLSGELGRLKVSALWRKRIASYRSALLHELPVERTVAMVASTNESYPAEKLIEVREAALRVPGRLLHVPQCVSGPL